MKLVRPGAARPATHDNRLRLGRAAGRLLAAGWAATLGLALAFGPAPDASGIGLAVAGAVIGLVLAERRWDRQQERSLRLLVAVGTLHAAAAMVALDPTALISAPIFVAVAVLAGLLAPTRAAVLGCGAALGLTALCVATLAPARDADALRHAIVLVPALMLAASLAAGARALRGRRVPAAPALGSAALVHAQLAAKARKDPDWFARLAMDLDLQEGRGLSRAEGNRFLCDVAEALIAHTRTSAGALQHANERLIERLERTVANIELEELGWFNFESAYEQAPMDEVESAELQALVAEALEKSRAVRGRRPVVADADVSSADAAELRP